MGRLDLQVLPGSDRSIFDLDPESAARPRIKLGPRSHPSHELGRISQVGEDCLGRGRDLPFNLDPGLTPDQVFDLLCSSVSASVASRSMSRVHIIRRYASTGRSAFRSAV